MKYAWLVIAVFTARFLVTAVAYPGLDGDLGWQRWLGATILRTGSIPSSLGPEAFSAPGAAWVPQEWIFGILAHLARTGLAWEAFSAGVALCATAALILCAYRGVRAGASPTAVAVCVTFAGIALLETFGTRAQVFAWPLFALYLLLLDIDGPLVWLALPVAALWSNVHASATIAPVLALIVASGSALDERRFGNRARRLTLVALGSIVAICCNPFGWRLPAYALMLISSPIKSYIVEWKVTDMGETSFAYGALPLLLLAAYAGTRNARRWGDVLIFALLALMMLGAARNIALFGLAAAPVVALAMSRTLPFFARDPDEAPPSRSAAWALPAISLAIAGGVAFALLHSSKRTEVTMPIAVLGDLQRTPGPYHLLCADFAWCSFVVGSPGISVFLDGRADPYPPAVWDDFLQILRLRDGWQAKLTQRGIDTVLVSRGSPLDQALARTPAWRALFSEAKFRIWNRPSAGVGLRTRHDAERGRREFFGSSRIFARVSGVPGVGVILGETLEQTDVETFIHLGSRCVPRFGELAREQLAAIERFGSAIVREGFLRTPPLERRIAVGDVCREAADIDHRVLQVHRDVAAG
jgi:hypothetical protein